MIVGQGPGANEIEQLRAFAGPSGKRLDEWLVQCGASQDMPRAAVYMTSVIKCVPPDETHFPTMIQNCHHFLYEQISIVKPELIVTLGAVAYKELSFTSFSYDQALCKIYRSQDFLLFTPVGFHYNLLAWPHPSGLNRWHNEDQNEALLMASFELLRPYLS
jgi:uracil-DNA glycosylase family 4